MQKMKNKIISVLLISLVASPLFAAKPKKEGKISKIKPKQTVTLKVSVPSDVDYKDVLDLQADELLKKLNVKLELVDENVEGQNFDLIVQDVTLPRYKTDCQNGAFLDLEENDLLTKWGPNLQNKKKIGVQKNKFFDSPDRRLHGYGLVLTISQAPAYVYTDPLKLCSDIVLSHYKYLEFGLGYYNPADGTFTDKLSSEGPYLYVLKFLNALHQEQYKFEDVKPELFEDLIKHYEENVNFHEVQAESDETKSDETKSDETKTDEESDKENSDETKSDGITEEKTSEAEPVESVEKIRNNYGSNYAWLIPASSSYPELCLAVINQLSLNELEVYSEYPVSLYAENAYSEEVEACIEKVNKILREKSIEAIEAENNEAYDAVVQEMRNQLSEVGYEKCKEHYEKQAQNRYFAEKLSQRTNR